MDELLEDDYATVMDDGIINNCFALTYGSPMIVLKTLNYILGEKFQCIKYYVHGLKFACVLMMMLMKPIQLSLLLLLAVIIIEEEISALSMSSRN